MARPRNIMDLLDSLAPDVQRAFMQSVENLRSDAQLNLMIAALQRGDIAAALRLLNIGPEYFAPLDQALTQAYAQGGEWAIEGVKNIARRQGAVIVARFDARNPAAEEYLRTSSSRLIVEIVEDTRNSIRERLTQNMAAGVSPRAAALDIVGRINSTTGRREGGLIGLTSQQQGYAQNALSRLRSGDPTEMRKYLQMTARDRRFDATVIDAINRGRPVDAQTATRIANRYKDILLRKRGETIARTELLGSLHEAQQQGTRQLIESGKMTADMVTEEWDAATDADTRDTHRAADGQIKRIDGTFDVGGYAMRYPGDDRFAPAEEVINCRCRVRQSFDFSSMLRGAA